ncbi:hypothetical protein GORHZ_006_00290 [Gordonia rhizosphera NBRC 16068]|uniref:Uncharacterized protein n=2 Tax=Gordonia rhizosphera TaxID=83341 RepID=K6VMN2_9ACTN|nr:hypothetical protein GORHZ_006_00290 [Gordonia rhizosphera NBRC 16068]
MNDRRVLDMVTSFQQDPSPRYLGCPLKLGNLTPRPPAKTARVIEARTGWSIEKFVTTARRYRTVSIQAGQQTATAADLIPDELQDALNAIRDDTH